MLLEKALLLALYVIAFFTFRKWLKDARACQQIRESFYREPDLLYTEPFEPIRKIEPKDEERRFEDDALWFPFTVTVVSAAISLSYTSLT